jgi:hypothetical protein
MAEFGDLKQTHRSLESSLRFLEIANRCSRVAPLLKAFVAEVRSLTGCEAVGIRILEEGGDIPYEAYDGFSREFYDLENRLSIWRDQCMCINIVKGDIDPKFSFYTRGGSFYINQLDQFFCTLSSEERGKLRGTCREFGYQSMALVPIRLGDKILGMIHTPDPRKDLMPRKISACKISQRCCTQQHRLGSRQLPERLVKLKIVGNVEGHHIHCHPDHHYSSFFFFSPGMEPNSSRMARTSR